MNKLIVASNNAGKVKEIKAILGRFYDCIYSLKDLGVNIDVVEDGASFYENALKKAVEVSRIVDGDVLADDSGLCVDALLGAPGVYSARYAGEHATDEENNAKLLADMEGKNNRGAKFVCALVVANNGAEKFYVEDSVDGVLLNEKRGENGFGYDPLFYFDDLKLTFAELPEDTKNKVSHRARALKRLAAIMEG